MVIKIQKPYMVPKFVSNMYCTDNVRYTIFGGILRAMLLPIQICIWINP